MEIQVFNPAGETETTVPFAARLDGLQGRTIGLLSNGHWQAKRTFPYLRELLAERFPDTKLVELDAGYGIDEDPAIDQLVQAGCEAVIVGHAS